MIFSSLLVCLVRDPGPPNADLRSEGAAVEGEEMGLREALMPDDDFSYPHKWCRKCWVCGEHPLCNRVLLSLITGSEARKDAPLLYLW